MDSDRYRSEWSDLHSGIDPADSRLVDGWLSLMYRCAAPLARRGVSPSVVTASAVLCAVCAVLSSGIGRWGALIAMVLIFVSSILDGMDGAVAVISGRVSAWGSVLDSTADRMSDLCFFACAAVVGVPFPLIAVLVVSTLVHESVRARAAAVGMTEVGVLTVWERPSRVVTVLVTLTMSVLFPGSPWTVVTGGAVGAAIAVLGLVQLMVVVHRRLSDGAGGPAHMPG